jgi:hypothetical protein
MKIEKDQVSVDEFLQSFVAGKNVVAEANEDDKDIKYDEQWLKSTAEKIAWFYSSADPKFALTQLGKFLEDHPVGKGVVGNDRTAIFRKIYNPLCDILEKAFKEFSK